MQKKESGADPIIVSIVVMTVVVFVGIMIAAFNSKGTAIESYKITDVAKPILDISERNFDFGQIKLSETKIKDINLKNNGQKILIISDVLTSCDCTFAQFVIADKESQKFSMQGDTKWRGEIQPGETAVLKIIYEPSLMPVKGQVNRSILFKTNDPQNSSVNINFTADVGS